MTFPTLINASSECSWYNLYPELNATQLSIQSAGNGELTFPYADFVPSGVTRTFRITHASLIIQGAQSVGNGFVNIVVESPSGSGKWKIVLWCEDTKGPTQDRFWPGIPVNPGDDICIQYGWNAQSAGPSWRFGSSTYDRALGAYLEYTIDP